MTQTQQQNIKIKNKETISQQNENPTSTPTPYNLKVISPQDYQKWQSSKQKIITAPLTFFFISSGLILVTKKLQLTKLLSNPLWKQEVLQKSQTRWSFLAKHTVLFGTLAVCAGAYFKKQFNKYAIFKEYQKEVNFYMRWKIENQILQFINEENTIESLKIV